MRAHYRRWPLATIKGHQRIGQGADKVARGRPVSGLSLEEKEEEASLGSQARHFARKLIYLLATRPSAIGPTASLVYFGISVPPCQLTGHLISISGQFTHRPHLLPYQLPSLSAHGASSSPRAMHAPCLSSPVLILMSYCLPLQGLQRAIKN